MPYRTPTPVAKELTMEEQLNRIFDILEKAPSSKWVFSLNCGDRVFTFKDERVTLIIEEHVYSTLGISVVLRDASNNTIEKDTERLRNLFLKLCATERNKELDKKKSIVNAVYQKLRGL